MADSPFRVRQDGVEIFLRVLPNARRNAIDGLIADPDGGTRLKLRVIAPALDGRANDAVLRMLAEASQLARSNFTLVRGEKSRDKHVFVRGEPHLLLSRFETWLKTRP